MNLIKSLIEKLLIAVGKVISKEKLDKESIVIMYANREKWLVQLYPQKPDLDMVEQLTNNFLLQVKTLKSKLEEEEDSKKRTIYTM